MQRFINNPLKTLTYEYHPPNSHLHVPPPPHRAPHRRQARRPCRPCALQARHGQDQRAAAALPHRLCAARARALARTLDRVPARTNAVLAARYEPEICQTASKRRRVLGLHTGERTVLPRAACVPNTAVAACAGVRYRV